MFKFKRLINLLISASISSGKTCTSMEYSRVFVQGLTYYVLKLKLNESIALLV
jgi:hypothetical protein